MTENKEPSSLPELHCPSCGYSLAGLPDQGECPECQELYWKPILRKALEHKSRKPSTALLLFAPATVMIGLFLIGNRSVVSPFAFWLVPVALITSIASIARCHTYKSHRPRSAPMDKDDQHIATLGRVNIIILLFLLLIAAGPMLLLGACML